MKKLPKEKQTQGEEKPSELTDSVIKQLEAYFGGKRKVFDIPHVLKGTEFQLKVWNELKEIPYG